MSEETMTETTAVEETVEEAITEETVEETPALTIEDIEAALALQFPPMPPAEPFAGDPTATWTYWSDMDTAERGVPTDWVWERLRFRRDQLLAECDWRVVADAPWDIQPWVEYRQALRDLPDVTTDPKGAVWPTKP
jgi:hypothetical protein